MARLKDRMCVRPFVAALLALAFLAPPAGGAWMRPDGSGPWPNRCERLPDAVPTGNLGLRAVRGWWIEGRLFPYVVESDAAASPIVVFGDYEMAAWLSPELVRAHGATLPGSVNTMGIPVRPFADGSLAFVVRGEGRHPLLLDDRFERLAEFRRSEFPPAADLGQLVPDDPDLLLQVPAVGDFDPGGADEFVFAGFREWMAFDASGAILARRPVDSVYSPNVGASPGVARDEAGTAFVYLGTGTLDYDGNQSEFVQRVHKLRLTPVPSGAPYPFRFDTVWTREFPTWGRSFSDPTILFADLTGDGSDEVLVRHGQYDTTGPAFTILDLDGRTLYAHATNAKAELAVADANGDGLPEVVALLSRDWFPLPPRHGGRGIPPGEAKVVGVQYESPGRWRTLYEFSPVGEGAALGVRACDMDGDGADEIVTIIGSGHPVSEAHAWGEGSVEMYGAEGSLRWSYRSFTGAPRQVIVDDVDGDGAREFLVNLDSGLLLLFDDDRGPSDDDYREVWRELAERADPMARNRLSPAELERLESWLALGKPLAPAPEPDPTPATPGPAAALVLAALGLAAMGFRPRYRR